VDFLGGLGAIFVTMLAKLIGYEFVSRVTVIGLKAWAESTPTHKDDEVVDAIANALGVDKAKVEALK
jgi:2-hydroxychromene-2-carboxylate isomerase